MAKSKIIRDLANGTVDTATALKRAKVLFSDLNNDELLKWVNYELIGYPDDATLPDYRVIQGNLIGTYTIGTMHNYLKYTNASVPLGKMPQDLIDDTLSISLYDGVSALKALETKSNATGNGICKTIPADCFGVISKYSNPFMNIASAQVEAGGHVITGILALVENRLFDALLLLEKEFGILDDLDLDIASKTDEEIESIAKQISVIIYNDNRVQIGDRNKIEGSTIASAIGENREA